MVILLVLANVFLLGLKLSNGSSSDARALSATAPISRSHVPAILLLHEVPEPELQTRTFAAECFSIGPTLSSTEIRQLKSSLSGMAVNTRERTLHKQVNDDFMVYTKPFASRTEALEYAKHLGSMGVPDYFVITSTALNNAISLGLYNDEYNARLRQNALRALGIEARVVARNKFIEEHWLDYRLAQDFDSPWDDLKMSIPGAVQTEISCAAWQEEEAAEQIASME